MNRGSKLPHCWKPFLLNKMWVKGEKKSKSFLVVTGITAPSGGTRMWGQEVVTRLATQGTEGGDKRTESGNGQMNEGACFFAERE